jgi:hypothetical protein
MQIASSTTIIDCSYCCFQLDLICVSQVFPNPSRKRDPGPVLRDAGGLDRPVERDADRRCDAVVVAHRRKRLRKNRRQSHQLRCNSIKA